MNDSTMRASHSAASAGRPRAGGGARPRPTGEGVAEDGDDERRRSAGAGAAGRRARWRAGAGAPRAPRWPGGRTRGRSIEPLPQVAACLPAPPEPVEEPPDLPGDALVDQLLPPAGEPAVDAGPADAGLAGHLVDGQPGDARCARRRRRPPPGPGRAAVSFTGAGFAGPAAEQERVADGADGGEQEPLHRVGQVRPLAEVGRRHRRRMAVASAAAAWTTTGSMPGRAAPRGRRPPDGGRRSSRAPRDGDALDLDLARRRRRRRRSSRRAPAPDEAAEHRRPTRRRQVEHGEDPGAAARRPGWPARRHRRRRGRCPAAVTARNRRSSTPSPSPGSTSSSDRLGRRRAPGPRSGRCGPGARRGAAAARSPRRDEQHQQARRRARARRSTRAGGRSGSRPCRAATLLARTARPCQRCPDGHARGQDARASPSRRRRRLEPRPQPAAPGRLASSACCIGVLVVANNIGNLFTTTLAEEHPAWPARPELAATGRWRSPPTSSTRGATTARRRCGCSSPTPSSSCWAGGTATPPSVGRAEVGQPGRDPAPVRARLPARPPTASSSSPPTTRCASWPAPAACRLGGFIAANVAGTFARLYLIRWAGEASSAPHRRRARLLRRLPLPLSSPLGRARCGVVPARPAEAGPTSTSARHESRRSTELRRELDGTELGCRRARAVGAVVTGRRRRASAPPPPVARHGRAWTSTAGPARAELVEVAAACGPSPGPASLLDVTGDDVGHRRRDRRGGQRRPAVPSTTPVGALGLDPGGRRRPR